MVSAHANNFDAVRLVAALLVLCSHQFFFLGKTQPSPTGNTIGEVAVMMFFVISGYLVAQSWYRDPHVVRFILRRCLRLWPALAVATIVIALASACVTTLSLRDYFGSATAHFIIQNLQLHVRYLLPGVFATAASKSMSAVNGSWWTIPVEMKCYLYLAILGLVGLRRRWISVLVLASVGVLYFRTLPGQPGGDTNQHLTYFYMSFFMTGVCARQFAKEFSRFRLPALGVGIMVFIAAISTGHHELAEWVALAPLVLLVGSLSTPGLRSAGRLGDLSYGIYVYAYFVQQLTIRLWSGTPGLTTSLLVAIAITAILAWCSWHAVEAPALRLKHHLRRWFPDRAA